MLGFAPPPEVALEHRRETRQEREARKLEKERVARAKERERSMREEHVDGGFLVTQGVYVGTEDFNKAVVRQLMIERRLAPFWRGLNDFSDSWTEHQLMAAARGLPIPAPDEIPLELENKTAPRATSEDAKEPSSDSKAAHHLMVPIASRSQSYNSDNSQTSSNPANSLPSPTSPIASGSFSSPLFRTRAKTLASLTTSTKHGSQTDLTPREIQLPSDPFVNGQPLEAYLYKDAAECPICFLYYPPYLNRTRCCDQPICSECFVQIKRPDPHPPEHGEPDPNAPSSAQESEGNRAESADTQLVSEPAACPFCVQPEFGVTYIPPQFRRGLSYAAELNGSRPPMNLASPMSSSTSSLLSGTPVAVTGRRRATSLSATDPTVVTTDKIRPDWAQKLANARAHAARRSAAATALHTAAYLVNNQNGSDSRNFSLGRRGLRRASNAPETRGSPALHALAFLTDRRPPAPPTQETETQEESNPAPRRGSSRRSRLDDLEEMMMMEAIRLSLASEEDRRKKEEKEMKKEAKRRDKDAKKYEKSIRKSGISGTEAGSSTGLSAARLGASSSSSVIEEEDEGSFTDKGKEVDRATPPTSVPATAMATAASSSAAVAPATVAEGAPSSSEDTMDQLANQTAATEPSKPSQLRNMASASSSFSSLVESTADEHATTADGSQQATEQMFNFRSLAEVIGDEDKAGEPTELVEHMPTKSEQPEGSGSNDAPAAAPKSMTQEVLDARYTASVEHASVTVPELPKELETRSVEITNTTPNPETT